MKRKMKMVNKNSVLGGLRRVSAAAVLAIGIMACAVDGFSLKAFAEEDAAAQETATETQASSFFTAEKHIDAKAEPKSSAETVFSYEAGAVVCVTGETEDGWYTVFYQGKTGYIDMDAAKDAFTQMNVDVAGLDAEMAAEEETSKMIIEETERYRTEARRSKIWAAVIIVLVVGIFAMGIVSTLRAGKNKAGQE